MVCFYTEWTITLSMFRCQGGIAAAAWKYYVDVGLVTGGNYNSGQVWLVMHFALRSLIGSFVHVCVKFTWCCRLVIFFVLHIFVRCFRAVVHTPVRSASTMWMDLDLHVKKNRHQSVLCSARLDISCLTWTTNILVNSSLCFCQTGYMTNI